MVTDGLLVAPGGRWVGERFRLEFCRLTTLRGAPTVRSNPRDPKKQNGDHAHCATRHPPERPFSEHYGRRDRVGARSATAVRTRDLRVVSPGCRLSVAIRGRRGIARV